MLLNYIKLKKKASTLIPLILTIAMLFGFKPKDNNAPAKSLKHRTNVQLYSASINFQNSDVAPPQGFYKDYGKDFGFSTLSAIGADFKYGWKNKETGEPIDLSEEATGNDTGSGRNRLGTNYSSASTLDQLEGTFIHLQGDNVVSSGQQLWRGQPRGNEAYWELEVPNGFFEITLSLGDKGAAVDSRHSATVEGYTIIPAFVPAQGQTKTATMLVEVLDGILTIDGLGGFNTKINYIQVEEILDDEDAASGVLLFTPDKKNIDLLAGEQQAFLATTLMGTNATTIGFSIDDNINYVGDPGKNDWISLPQSNGVGDYNFNINSKTLVVGDSRKSTIVATAAGFKPALFEASLNLVAGCSPLSILACNSLLRDLPIRLNFDAAGEGLSDATGIPTGFTTATPHSAARLTADNPVKYPSVNGYEPSKLTVKDNELQINATKGISFLAQNRQVNTLGVAFDNPSVAFEIETKLMENRMPTTGFAQAGLHFGFNEDNYVKLVVLNNTSIQLKKEIGGASIDGINTTDDITVQNLILNGKSVALRMVLDPEAMTISAYYSLDNGDFLLLGGETKTSLELPEILLSGRTTPTEVEGASLAGIFATYNNGNTSFKTRFDYFTIREVPTLGIATATAKRNKPVLYPNPASQTLHVYYPQDNSGVNSISIYDLQGRKISVFEPKNVSSTTGYSLPLQRLASGLYLLQLADDRGNLTTERFVVKQ